MAEKKPKDYCEVAKFVADNMKLVGEKDGGPKYQVNQEQYTEFLVNSGIPKPAIAQFNEATSTFNNGVTQALSDLLVADTTIPKATINIRTQNGVISTKMTREVETRTPGTNERINKYGVVSIRINLKSRMDRDLLAECAQAVEESSK